MVAVTNFTFTYSASSFLVRCSMKENHHNQMNSNSSIRMNGSFRSPIKVESLSQTAEVASTTLVANGQRQNIPTEKQLVDPHSQGLIVEGGVGYRQTVVIRSVGPMKLVLIKLQHLRAFSIFFR
jgi:fatty acyl-ACP thioesterase B